MLVGDAHELGALELARRVLGVDADDRLDGRVALERLRRAARPSRSRGPVTRMRLLGPSAAILATWSDRSKRWTSDGVDRMNSVTPPKAKRTASGPRRRSAAPCGRRWTRRGVSRFPGAQERIPNFANARGAAERLAAIRPGSARRRSRPTPTRRRRTRGGWRSSRARRSSWRSRACATQHPFRLLDPSKLTEKKLREAATIKGALRHGEVIDVEQVPKLDLILCGSVAVNLKGARIGKGGGFSDLEYALLAEAGTVSDKTVVATTVHPIQILRENLPVDRPRHPGRPDRDAARGDRSRARVSSAPRASSGTTCSRRRSTRSRCSSGWGTRRFGRPQAADAGQAG